MNGLHRDRGAHDVHSPAGSILIEWSLDQSSLLWLIGKWFVFWAVGVRLLLAGVRQYFQPAFTAKDILGIESPDVFVLVRELEAPISRLALLAWRRSSCQRSFCRRRSAPAFFIWSPE